MRHLNTIYSNLIKLTICAVGVILISCGDDSEVDTPEAPFADFTVSIDEVNTLTVMITNNSLDGDAYSWDFGDGTGSSTDENPTYTYSASGTYTITLSVTNEGGTDEATQEVTVSGFGPNLLTNGDMSTEESWSSVPLWTNDDNLTDHRFENGTFIFQNAEDGNGGRYQWSNHVFYQEVSLNPGSTYQFSADVSSTSGTLATWFEVFLVSEEPVDESNIGGDAVQLGIKSFGDGENCTAEPFEGDILSIAAECTSVNDFSGLIGSNGQFTVSADDLSSNNTVFLVFKAGSGFAPEGETAGFKDGLILDNVVIKEVL